jgi:hypothetical protein
MESWRKVWREGLAPQLPTAGLHALAEALARDDPRIIQGATTSPPPISSVLDWPIEGTCVIGFCGWQGEDLETVGEVEEFFARICREVDRWLGEPAACRYFLNWYDETPRDEMRRELIEEVRLTLAERFPMEKSGKRRIRAA